MSIVGDPHATTPGWFHGYSDPMILHDPDVADRLWLVYSWLSIATGQDPDGNAVSMAAVSSHLARSDDRGTTFGFVGELYAETPIVDPEGSGEQGLLGSETVSLAAISSGTSTTWYGAHLRYFLRPLEGYNPKYGTSWTVRVGAAPSPPELGDAAAQANEAVLGVTGTAAVYQPNARLNELAGLPIEHCAMVNNPSLYSQGDTLYLAVECLAFVGTTPDHEHSTIQLFATTPAGDPQSWTWRHVGMPADYGVAVELYTRFGAEAGAQPMMMQPNLTLAADGTLLMLLAVTREDLSQQVASHPEGCVALELTSLEPPVLARDCDGQAVVRAAVWGDTLGACTFDAISATGIIAHNQQQGVPRSLYATGLAP